MTDVQPMGADTNPAPISDMGSATDAAASVGAPYAQGSRLRRALDIARQAGGAAAPPVTAEEPSQGAGTSQSQDERTEPTAEASVASPPTGDTSPALDAETWETAVQGWIQQPDGKLEWRPIVTTVDRLDRWEVATYLGIAAGEADAGIEPGAQTLDPASLAKARSLAVARLVDDALARGAHGVLGVEITVTNAAGRTMASAVGTAVTLTHRHAERVD